MFSPIPSLLPSQLWISFCRSCRWFKGDQNRMQSHENSAVWEIVTDIFCWASWLHCWTGIRIWRLALDTPVPSYWVLMEGTLLTCFLHLTVFAISGPLLNPAAGFFPFQWMLDACFWYWSNEHRSQSALCSTWLPSEKDKPKGKEAAACANVWKAVQSILTCNDSYCP